MAVKLPPGWHTVTPRLFVDDAADLVTFLKRVFGATGRFRDDRPSEITIGDSIVMIAGTEVRNPMPACLYVYVDDVDAVCRRATKAGAIELEPPADMPWGDRRGIVKDRWGNVWQIATHLRDW
jgi:PhnB protein